MALRSHRQRQAVPTNSRRVWATRTALQASEALPLRLRGIAPRAGCVIPSVTYTNVPIRRRHHCLRCCCRQLSCLSKLLLQLRQLLAACLDALAQRLLI